MKLNCCSEQESKQTKDDTEFNMNNYRQKKLQFRNELLSKNE